MSFGADCFLDCERNGFKGQIKQTYPEIYRWQDFVVTEIDSQGKLVELIPGKILSVKEEEQNDQLVNCRNKNYLEQKSSLKKSEGKSLNEKPFLTQISESFEVLKDLAMKDMEKSLSIAKLKEFVELALLIETNRASEKKICIGSGLTKEQRTFLHRNIRLAYPHLQTETIQSDQEGEPPLIFAGNDKVYWEFNDLLNDRHQVDRLLCFAHWENRRIPSTLNIDVSSADKQQRTKIHRLLSKHFGSFLESKTFNQLDGKLTASVGHSYIQIRMRTKGAKSPCQQNNKPDNQRQIDGEYTGFVLCKRNMETLEVIQRLSTCLSIQPSAFSYAGIKDKKAITKQYMVVRGVTPEQMCAIEGHPSLEGIECGSYRRDVKTPLRMGALSGNHFQVVIRNMQCNNSHEKNVEECKKNIQDATSSLSHHGFLNYFGPQRFGLDDKEVNACDIGLAMLQGNMIKVVKLLMTSSEHNPDHPVNAAKRYYCETGDVQGTLSKMPGYKVRETLVLKALHRHGTDMDGCRKALLNIPYSMRLLYVHSYCSLVWNLMASYRIQRYGRSAAVQGDLIVDKSASAHSFKSEAADSNHDSDVDSCGNESSGVTRNHVRCIANHEQEIYQLKDVVLPLPGYNVQYPANDVGETYKKRLEEDGLTTKSFRLRGLGMNLPGAYRKLVAFPSDLSWNYVKDEHAYTGNTSAGHSPEPKGSGLAGDGAKRLKLATNDYCKDKVELLEGLSSQTTELSKEGLTVSHNCCNDIEISFSLEPSCYATSCIRELMKN